jgi:hypothetical protein
MGKHVQKGLGNLERFSVETRRMRNKITSVMSRRVGGSIKKHVFIFIRIGSPWPVTTFVFAANTQ